MTMVGVDVSSGSGLTSTFVVALDDDASVLFSRRGM
jgi:hypothetical protein